MPWVLGGKEIRRLVSRVEAGIIEYLSDLMGRREMDRMRIQISGAILSVQSFYENEMIPVEIVCYFEGAARRQF